MVIRNTVFRWLKKVIQRQLSVVTEILDYNTKADSKFEPSMAVRETSAQNVNPKYVWEYFWKVNWVSFVKSSLNTPHTNWTLCAYQVNITQRVSCSSISSWHPPTQKHMRVPSPFFPLVFFLNILGCWCPKFSNF